MICSNVDPELRPFVQDAAAALHYRWAPSLSTFCQSAMLRMNTKAGAEEQALERIHASCLVNLLNAVVDL